MLTSGIRQKSGESSQPRSLIGCNLPGIKNKNTLVSEFCSHTYIHLASLIAMHLEELLLRPLDGPPSSVSSRAPMAERGNLTSGIKHGQTTLTEIISLHDVGRTIRTCRPVRDAIFNLYNGSLHQQIC